MARIFTKKIIKPGVYQGEKVTADRIKHWANTHTEMVEAGLLTPAPYFHDKLAIPVRGRPGPEDANSKNNSGFWNRLFVDSDGYLVGEIEASTDEDAKRLGKSIKQVSLAAAPEWEEGGKVWKDAITHIALTNHAIAPTGDEFVPVVAMSAEMPFQVFSLEMLTTSQLFDHESGAPDAGDEKKTAPGDDGTEGTSGLDSLLSLLAEHGIELTDDTDQNNFVDHLTSALTAIASHKKEQEGPDLTKQPEGSKTQKPSPIAMSHELELAVSLLDEAKLTDPATEKPFTVEGLQAAAEAKHKAAHISMSAENQAQVNWAIGNVKQQSSGLIKEWVADQKVSPVHGKEIGAFFDSNFIVELAADGTRKQSWFDLLAKIIGDIPKGVLMSSPQTPEGNRFTVDFANDPNVVVEQLPEGAETKTYTEEEAEKIADSVLGN